MVGPNGQRVTMTSKVSYGMIGFGFLLIVVSIGPLLGSGAVAAATGIALFFVGLFGAVTDAINHLRDAINGLRDDLREIRR